MEKSAAAKPLLNLPLGKAALGGAGLAGLAGIAAIPGLLGATLGTFGPAPYVSATQELARRMKERKKGLFTLRKDYSPEDLAYINEAMDPVRDAQNRNIVAGAAAPYGAGAGGLLGMLLASKLGRGRLAGGLLGGTAGGVGTIAGVDALMGKEAKLIKKASLAADGMNKEFWFVKKNFISS